MLHSLWYPVAACRRLFAGTRAPRAIIRPLMGAASVCVISACASMSTRGSTTTASAPDRGDALRVMSFNLRFDNPGDGINAWPNRRDWVASLLRYHDADVIGVQEALGSMLRDLDSRTPEYARFGVGRTDGIERGEFSAILYRRDRLAIQDSGTFWLSPTPTVIGSKGWDAAIERIATWALFRDRRTGCRFVMLNTHFDHVGEVARQESAKLIRRRLADLSRGMPVVMTGDLNSDPRSSAYRSLTRDTVPDALPPLRDAFAISTIAHYGPTSTWTAFKAIEPERRIDYVLVSSEVRVFSHAILPDSWDGRFPSDHLPVIAALSPCR